MTKPFLTADHATGNVWDFPSEEAFDAAEEWMQSKSVDDVVSFWVKHEGSNPAIWRDGDRDKGLAEDWYMHVMDLWAKNEFSNAE